MPRVYIPVITQRAVLERAQGRCEYCQSRADYATGAFAVEHIVPVSRGGSSALDNLAFACAGCNGHKYTRTEAPDPTDNTRVPFYHPRQQRWDCVFRRKPATDSGGSLPLIPGKVASSPPRLKCHATQVTPLTFPFLDLNENS